IVFAGYGGEGINEALADVLLGKTNPSGKLSETFITCEDNEFVDGVNSTDSLVRYNEGVFVGYRRMNDPSYKIIYPFGYGLSYSNFEYSSLRINKLSETDYEVFVDIENASDIDGKEVIQLYVSDLSSSVSRPLRELKGFEKVFIPAREKKTVSFKLDKSSFAFYNASIHDWYVENGLFEIQIGSSSIDIKLREKIDIELDFYSQYSRER
ncbi:MAG: fibronectin type III-like domain-contianing protein, partial [Bacillales bacterium]|nr:fibronectin type III-like domain-contianing protein [Bacillales bacterium]